MYLEFNKGILEVITGPMFSGKSGELIKRIKILSWANIETLVFKPAFDKRWDEKKIASRLGKEIDAISIDNPEQILIEVEKIPCCGAICIDEAHFFDEHLIDVVLKLVNDNRRVIISGLDQDYEGKPFGPMPALMAMAEIVDKQKAVCIICKRAATMSYRKTNNGQQKLLGDVDLYEARCRECHFHGENSRGCNVETHPTK